MVNNWLKISSPDKTLVSSDIALWFIWQIINETLGSDNVFVKFSTHIEENIELKPSVIIK